MDTGPRILIGIAERPGTVVLRLAGDETLEIAPDAVPADLPDVGGSLGFPRVVSLRAAAARKLAARRLLALLDRRLSSPARLRRTLLAEGHPPDAVAAVLAAAADQDLVSDRRFAEAFCRDALRAKPVGRAWLQAKLREQGVPGDVATAVVADLLTPERERALAAQAAARRLGGRAPRDERARAQLRRFLAARGFPPAVCADVARRAGLEEAAGDMPCNSDLADPS